MLETTVDPDLSPVVCKQEKGVSGPTKVLLVDDHPVIREGFRRLLEKNEEFEVVGAVDSVEDALDALARSSVEMVVMDIQLPGLDGVEGTKLVKAKYPDVKVVIVSSYGEAYLIPAIAAGPVTINSRISGGVVNDQMTASAVSL